MSLSNVKNTNFSKKFLEGKKLNSLYHLLDKDKNIYNRVLAETFVFNFLTKIKCLHNFGQI